jgi:hypothetical protein
MKTFLIAICIKIKCACVLFLLLAMPSMAGSQTIIGVRDDLSREVDRILHNS